jgi:DNA ligase D-like protein (predicted 3'-phosphoesterase)
MSLKEYNKKRNFSKTKEPKGKTFSKKHKKLIYVIQKHAATRLHYDLRLEMNNVLVSWAVPKEPPMEKGIKRLAVMTEDHPIGYEKFHGTIPKGEYGGGEVEIWDSGFYELKIKDAKKIEFFIHGKKLKGNYILVKTNFGGNKKSWLFMKL